MAEMTSAERVMTVLRREQPDRIPHFEWIIDRNSSIRGGSTAVFEKDGKIVAVTEVKPEVKKSEYSSLVESLKTDIRMVFSLGISIYLVKKGSVIKTTSGKVSRGKCRDGLDGMRVVFSG